MASLSFCVRVSPSATEKLASYWTSTVESVSKLARPSRNRWPYCFIRVVVYWKLCSGDTLNTFHVLPIRSANKNTLNYYLFVQITESIYHAVYFRKQFIFLVPVSDLPWTLYASISYFLASTFGLCSWNPALCPSNAGNQFSQCG